MAAGPSRSAETLTRLAELLFVDAVGRYLAELPADESGWTAGVRDPKIAEALGLLHAQLRRRWTADELARQVAMSRSAFTERFTRIMGAFAETKEQLGGILILEARDMPHAIELMSRHPGVKYGPFEIRPAADLGEMITQSELRRRGPV